MSRTRSRPQPQPQTQSQTQTDQSQTDDQSQPEPDETQYSLESHQPVGQLLSQPQSTEPQLPPMRSFLSIATLAVRMIILVSLIVSLIILLSNTASYGAVTFRFKDVYAYRYMMSTISLGITYSLMQIPVEIGRVSAAGKPMINMNQKKLLQLLFMATRVVDDCGRSGWLKHLGMQVVLCLLGTGVGAGFGATLDLKKNMDDLETIAEVYYNTQTFYVIRQKLDDFFDLAYVSISFLLIAFLCSIASSILSSLALSNKP